MSPFWKPERRSTRKAREDRTRAAQRQACVNAVWQREQGRCENPRCRRLCVPPRLAVSPAQDNVGHVHERVLRSRGGDPTNPDECVLACNVCHDGLHRKRRPWLRITAAGGWEQWEARQ